MTIDEHSGPSFEPSSRPRSQAAGIFLGALPWALAGLLFGLGFTRLAAGTKVTLALLQNYRCLQRKKQPKALEVTTLLYGGVEAALTLGLGKWWVLAYGGVASQAALGVMALGSVLVGSPFTYQYAREAWPREYWKNELFIRTNVIISCVFAAVFAISAGSSLLALCAFGTGVLGVLFGAIVPIVFGIAAMLFSIAFPKYYTRRALSQTLAERYPYDWPIPKGDRAADFDCDVVVIGAGIGGLAAAALLAKRGLLVTVLEKHNRPGGSCSSWSRTTPAGTFVFDAGVHDISGLSARGATTALLTELGLQNVLNWKRTHHGLWFEGQLTKIPSSHAEFVLELGEAFPEERENLRLFWQEIEAIYRELYADIESTGGVPTHPRTVDAMLSYPKLHPALQRSGKRSFKQFLESHVTSPKLRRILSSLGGYLTDDLAKVTVAEMAPIFGYYIDGGHYPIGSSQAFADALVQSLEAHRGTLRLSTPVKRILVNGGTVSGVELSRGRVLRAPIVISNADLKRTYLELVGESHLSERERAHARALEPSPSALMTFLGLDFVPSLPPLLHASVEGIGFGIATTSLLDPALAPKGHSAVTLTSLVTAEDATTWDRNSPGYRARKTQSLDRLVELAEQVIIDLRAHIVYREDASPATFSRYLGATNGAIYGVERGQQVHAAKTSIRGLLVAGSGVTPGSGIEAVIISGMLAAREVRAT